MTKNYLKRFKKGNDQLQKSSSGIFTKSKFDKNLLKQIFTEVEEGIFLLNSQFSVENYFTNALRKILDENELKLKSFPELLVNHVTDDTINLTLEYFNFMFRQDLDEETLHELNPLAEIEFHIKDEWGLWTTSKFLSFKFKRIYKNEKIEKLFCTVRDISKEIELNRQLSKLDEYNKKQMEWMINILHIKPSIMLEFMDLIDYKLKKIETVLKESINAGDYVEIAKNIGNSVQMIAKNASLLDLKFFEEVATQLYEKIDLIKNNPNISGSDFVPIVIHLGEIRKKFEEIKTLVFNLENFKNTLRTTRNYEGQALINSLEKQIDELCLESGKQVMLVHDKFDALTIPYTHQQLIRGFLYVLTRFVIIYSVEKPNERKKIDLNPVATIELESIVSGNKIDIIFRHDGRLIRTKQFIEHEITVNSEVIEDDHLSKEIGQFDSRILELFFKPLPSKDLSETDDINEIYQDIQFVKKKLSVHGGRIKITFTDEQSVEYNISIPKK